MMSRVSFQNLRRRTSPGAGGLAGVIAVCRSLTSLLLGGFVLGGLLGPPASGQVPATRFEHLSVDDGLSHSAIHDMVQDRHGFLWFATRNGLNRYDGRSFRVFQHDPDDPDSLTDSLVGALLEDRDGRLWVGTPSGLDVYDFATDRFVHHRHDPDDPLSLSSDSIGEIFEDRAGNLWVATEQGIDRRNPDGSFLRLGHDPADPTRLADPRVLALVEDRGGRMWVGGYGGLSLFDPTTATFRSFRHDPADPTSLGENLINALVEDPGGGLWVGTARGLYHFDSASEVFAPYPQVEGAPYDLASERIFELLVDGEGDLWVGTLNAGMFRIPQGGGPPTQFRHDDADPWSLSGDRVMSLFEDRSGVLWASTYVGLNKYDRRREQFATYRREPTRPSTLSDSNISALFEDRGGALWVGTWDKGLNRLDRERGTVAQFQPDATDTGSLPDDTVLDVTEDRSGALWVATWGGLARRDPGQTAFTVYRPDPEDPESLDSDAVIAVHEDRAGRIWVGTILGLSRFEPRGERFVRRPLSDGIDPGVSVLSEDSAGILWLGTSAGLLAIDPATPESVAPLIWLQHDPDDPDSLANDEINDLHLDRSGTLWVATDGGGLDRMEWSPESPERATFRHLREADGLASNQVLCILEDDDGRLWLSTSRGLSRFDPGTGSVHNFGVADGLQSSVFSYRSALRDRAGTLYFGGTHGFNAFRPERIRTDPVAPPVVLTDFQLFNRSVPLQRIDPSSPLERSILETEDIRLTHRQNVFSIEFAALHFASPGDNRYAYQLEGFDADWIPTSAERRLATYTNLDAGSYVFRVRAANKDGVWNEEGASLRITVLPPPWQTWWAYMLYGLGLVALIGWGVSSQRRELRREREAAEYERAVSHRLREVDRLKDEFLANTSHELRTPLYGIVGLAESLLDGAAGELPDAARSDLSMIVGSGRRLGQLVNDVLDHSRLTHGSLELRRQPVDLRPLVEVVLALQAPLAASKDLELRNAIPADLPAADADEARLEQILHNLVGNAIKFTEQGWVEVAAKVATDPRSMGRGEELLVAVEDSGIGIPEDQQERIFEAFEQAEAGIQRTFGGTGLGLAVTRELVELHGGRIWVESRVGQGTSFSLALPISARPAETSDPPGSAPLLSTPLHPTVQRVFPSPGPSVKADREGVAPALVPQVEGTKTRPRILVVDDEPINLQVLSNHLASEGYDVELVSNGADALHRLANERFDLVVLDVMMPGMSGYEVCRALREDHPLEQLPVIFLTAKNQVPDLVTGLAAGGNDYLSKPIGKDELLARVRTHLELLTVNRDLAAKNAELARFNYTVAHDLRNPLTTIKNFLGLVRRDAAAGSTGRLERDLDRLDAAADRLHRLLDELFELSRVGSRTMPSDWVDVGELARQVVVELAEPIADQGLRVTVAPDLPEAWGDRERLREVVRHLLSNSVRYGGERSKPRIEVSFRQDGSETVYVVRDDGIGIDPKYHDKVFGLFERLDPLAFDGTGIGLTLVQRIVEVHGGRIWVESEGSGSGCAFCFTLPATPPSTPPTESRSRW